LLIFIVNIYAVVQLVHGLYTGCKRRITPVGPRFRGPQEVLL